MAFKNRETEITLWLLAFLLLTSILVATLFFKHIWGEQDEKLIEEFDLTINLDNPKWKEIRMQSFLDGLELMAGNTDEDWLIRFRDSNPEFFRLRIIQYPKDIEIDVPSIQFLKDGEFSMNDEPLELEILKSRVRDYSVSARLVEAEPFIYVHFSEKYRVKEGAELIEEILVLQGIDTILLQ